MVLWRNRPPAFLTSIHTTLVNAEMASSQHFVQPCLHNKWSKIVGVELRAVGVDVVSANTKRVSYIKWTPVGLCVLRREVRAAAFIGGNLYRVAPSLYNPILGLVWWFFDSLYVRFHQLHPVDGGQSHCLCLSQSSLLCSKLGDRSSWSSHGPDDYPEPLHLSLCSYTFLSKYFQISPCNVCCILWLLTSQICVFL